MPAHQNVQEAKKAEQSQEEVKDLLASVNAKKRAIDDLLENQK